MTCDDLDDWHVELSRVGGSPHEGAEGAAARAADGSIVVAFHDPFSNVLFGTEQLSGAHVARISSDGQILAHAPAPDGDSSHTADAVGATADGGFVVKWSTTQGMVIASYDAALNQRWSVPLAGIGFFNAFAVGPEGQVAVEVQHQDPQSITSSVVVLATDGNPAWQIDNGGKLQFADNGDLFVFGGTSDGLHRWRRAAADGAVLEDVAISIMPDVTASDGSFAFASYPPDVPNSARVAKFDASASLVWSKTFPVRSYNLPIFTTTGDIAALVSYQDPPTFSWLVLDGATGDKRAEPSACAYVVPISVDTDHYYGLGMPGSTSVGIASFPMR